jgi:hypothetical protein
MNQTTGAPSSARSKSTRWTKPLRRFEHAPLDAADPGSETRSKFHCVKPPLRRRPKGFDQHSLCLTARSPLIRSLSPAPCEASPKFEASNRCGALKGLVFIRPHATRCYRPWERNQIKVSLRETASAEAP